jgi:hypothetical protein
MENWVILGLVLVVLLQFVAIGMLIRIMTQGEIVVKAIPFGSMRMVERPRPQVPQHRGE